MTASFLQGDFFAKRSIPQAYIPSEHKFCAMVFGPWTVGFAAAALKNCQTSNFFRISIRLMPTVLTEFGIQLSLCALPIALSRVVYVLLLAPESLAVDTFRLFRTVIIGLAMLALLFLGYSSFAISVTVLRRCSCRCETNPRMFRLTHCRYTRQASGSSMPRNWSQFE